MAASSNCRRRASRGRRVPLGRVVGVAVTMFSGFGRWLLTIVLVVIPRVPDLLRGVGLVYLERQLGQFLVVLFRDLASLLGGVLVRRFNALLAHCPTSATSRWRTSCRPL